MIRLRRLALAFSTMLFAPSSSPAQVRTSADVRPGPPMLRVPTPGSLLLRPSPAGLSDTTPKRVIQPTYWLEGALIVGIPVSLLTTAFVWGMCNDPDSGGGHEPCWDDALLGAVIGFGTGASLGGLLGGLVPKPEPTRPDTLPAP
jgi:hypothetical protein